MTIKNISNKIINIGTTVLMPEQSMTASEAICNTPAIKAFQKRKMLEISKPVEVPKEPEKKQDQDQHQEQDHEPDASAFDADKAPKKAPKPKK